MACLKKPLLSSSSSEVSRTLQHPLLRPRTHILTVPFFLLSLFLLSASYTTNSPNPSPFPFSLNMLSRPPPVTLSVSETQPQRQSRDSVFSSVTAAERTHGNSTQDLSSCDIFDGAWVRDNAREPIYQPGLCPFLDDAFNCFKNGRSDFEYLKYRWKPHGCHIPRFLFFLSTFLILIPRGMFV